MRSRKSRKTRSGSKAGKAGAARARLWRIGRWALWGLAGLAAIAILTVALFGFVDPPGGLYMRSEAARLGSLRHEWVPLERVSPDARRAVVAAEDANFCLHWGFDVAAIRDAIEDGGQRGASTISQQVVKNVFLWHGRSWPRKALEAVLTPLVELFWSKRRILEVYLNIAEFGPGIFGIEAAARHHFGVGADRLTLRQGALLAAVLPDPKGRSPVRPSAFVRRRAEAIMDGAATIRADGRDACFR